MTNRRNARPGLWTVRGPMSQRNYWLFAAAGLLIPLLAWWGLASAELVSKVFMPGPAEVWSRVVKWSTEDNLLGDTFISIYRVTVGWLLSAVIALPLGLLIGTLPPGAGAAGAAHRFHPLHAGGGLHSAGHAVDRHRRGLQDRHHLHRHLLPDGADGGGGRAPRADGADRGGADHGRDRGEIIELVLLQVGQAGAARHLRITMGWAWTYLVVAELVAANSGLGYAILKAQRFLQTDKIFAGIIIIGLIGLITDQLFRLAAPDGVPVDAS